MAAGVLKLYDSQMSFIMIAQLLIIGVSVCICMGNGFDDNDYINEPRDMSLQIHRHHQEQKRQQQQQPFSFDNLQRFRTKLQDGARNQYGNINNNNNDNDKTENDKNEYRNSHRIEDDKALVLRDSEISGLQKSHPNDNNQPKFNEMEFFDEFESNLPYGIQNVRRDLSSRSSRSQPRMHKPKTTFQSLCPSKRLVIPLETIEYVYRPDHYEEVTCYHSYAPNRDYLSETNKVCSEAGFTCIQLNRTVYLTRRAKGSDCWESETRIVPSGCECMWPKHTFGDIITYH